MVDHDPLIAAEWWEHHSNSHMGAAYAAIIRTGGDGHALGRGQLAAIIAKGSIKGRSIGITAPQPPDPKPTHARKSKG